MFEMREFLSSGMQIASLLATTDSARGKLIISRQDGSFTQEIDIPHEECSKADFLKVDSSSSPMVEPFIGLLCDNKSLSMYRARVTPVDPKDPQSLNSLNTTLEWSIDVSKLANDQSQDPRIT
jgi:uncharacterized Zn finger protein